MKKLLLMAILSQSVYADYNRALHDYEENKFAEAFTEFKRLAELGDADSQRNLAAMYARGEGVSKNVVEAYGWATLALAQDPDGAGQLRQALIKGMTKEEIEAGQKREQGLQGQFSQQALATNLMPISSGRQPDCAIAVTGDAIPVKMDAPRYPIEAAKQGTAADVRVKFYLTAHGTTVGVQIVEVKGRDVNLSASLKRAFSTVTTSAINKWQFLPATDEWLREIPREYQISYQMLNGIATQPHSPEEDVEYINQAISSDNTETMHQIAQQLNKQYGCTSIQVTTEVFRWPAGKSASGADSTAATRESNRQQLLLKVADRLSLRAAINGNAEEQYSVAKKLLTGDRCEKDLDKGMTWLAMAAQQRQPDAQYLLSRHLAAGDGIRKDPDEAQQWLRAAAESGHEQARIRFAMQLLKQDRASVDSALALLPMGNDDDISVLEVKALAAAISGQQRIAVQYQEKVLAIANEQGFDTEQRLQWLKQFRVGAIPDSDQVR